MPALKLASLDLETSDLSANYGVILCAVVKPEDEEPVVIRGDDFPTWAHERSSDRFLCTYLSNELQQYQGLVIHNGKDFDLKYLNTRLVIAGMPPVPPKFLVDTCRLARNKLRLNSNRLDQLISSLGLDNLKTPVDSNIWLKATLDGDREAMDYIVEHCIRDTVMLEQVWYRISCLVTQLNQWGSDR